MKSENKYPLNIFCLQTFLKIAVLLITRFLNFFEFWSLDSKIFPSEHSIKF